MISATIFRAFSMPFSPSFITTATASATLSKSSSFRPRLVAAGVPSLSPLVTKALLGWSEISQNIFIWDYGIHFDNYVTPFPNLHILQDNIQLFKENGAKGSCMCNIHPCLKDDEHIKTTMQELCYYIRENYDMEDII